MASVNTRGSRKRCGSLRHPQNLINVNCSDPNTRSGGNFNHPLSLCLLNARSVKNKTALLLAYIRDCSADLYDIPETWLTDKDASVKAEFCPAGYNFIEHPRTGYRGGSTGLVFRDSLRVKMVDAGGKDSFEFSEWLVSCLGCSLRLLIVYRPPYSTKHKVTVSVCLREFSDYLESFVLSKEHILIAGDFNIHVDDIKNVDAVTFLDVLESFGLQQHVTQPTHILGHTLDLIISQYFDNLLKAPPVTDFFVSDHISLMCNLTSRISYSTAKVINYRKLRQIDMESFKKDLSETSLCQRLPDGHFITSTEYLNKLVADYNSTLSNLLNHHAPLKSKTVRKRPSVPRYRAEIGAAKRLRRKAERKWRRTGLHEDFIAFKSQRNRTTFLMNASRKTFYADFISENSTDQGKLFRAAKKLLSMKEELCFPNYSDKTILVNDTTDFFVSKIDTIRSNIDASSLSCSKETVPEDFEIGPQKVLSSFKPLTEAAICKLIQSSAKKSCALDPMPTPLVVSCLDVLLPVIATIVNSSLLTGRKQL